MAMTELERFKATLAHEKHAGVLFYAEFTPDLENRIGVKYGLNDKIDLRKHYRMFNPTQVELRPPEGYKEPDYSVYFEDIEIKPGAFINHLGVLETPGSAFHFTHYTSPLRNAEKFEELEAFPFPHFDGYTGYHLADEVKTAHKQGRVASCWVGHMYEDSWQIRGYEQFLIDMVVRPDWCEFILENIKQRNMTIACAAANAGVDYIITGDDIANQKSMMFALEQWRKLMKPRWAEVYAAARAIKSDIEIWYHSDGCIDEVIPELIEIGVTILNPVQPECIDPVEVKKSTATKLY